MKTKTISLIAMFIAVLGITNSTYAAASNNATVITLNNISAINKIEVHGNVELYISDGSADQVKVYNKYYSESALIQSTNGVLRISSYKAEKLVVWVTAADLRSVSAYDNADIKSFGDLSKIEFNVDLHNNASAKLNLDAYSANVNLTDSARADLSGTANEFTLNHNMGSSVNNSNFTAVYYKENKINTPAADEDADLAGL
jgi:DUF4097 and DUF4098 domain-containing protein YvlB